MQRHRLGHMFFCALRVLVPYIVLVPRNCPQYVQVYYDIVDITICADILEYCRCIPQYAEIYRHTVGRPLIVIRTASNDRPWA